MWRTSSSDARLVATTGHAFIEPSVLASEGGLLEVELEAAPGVQLAGRETRALGYNGTSPGPTWRIRPGDTLRVNLVNRLDEPTNLHVHGLHVSPEGPGDNPFVEVGPGDSVRYEYEVPATHPEGTFWYHPHHHGNVAQQVFGGLAGAIVVVGDGPGSEDEDRILVVTDTTLDGAGQVIAPTMHDRMMGREGELLLVNGQLQPTLVSRPGARHRWRIINGCVSRFLRLRLEAADFVLLALDGRRSRSPRRSEEVLLAPGNRADLGVEAAAYGRFRLLAEPYDRGRMGMGMGAMMLGEGSAGEAAVLAVLEVTGEPVSPAPLRWDATGVEDLRDRPVASWREIRFGTGMGPGGMRFTIDGREFDPHRVDTQVRVDDVEEWLIRNSSPMDHPFHLHVWPFQVLDEGFGPLAEPEWRDVVNVPAGRDVRIRIRFADFGGRTVYHCHVLDHEDLGMMAVIQAT